MSGTFKLRQERWNDDLGQHYEEYVFRTTHWLPTDTDPRVKNPNLLLYAARRGVEETGSVVKYIVVGFARLVEGRISLATVSGPITMYDIAGEAGAKGTTYFLWAMALISLNLGIINLLPIPVLDGGTLFFLVIEGLRRRPVTLRTREIASLVGMIVLVLLMMVAFKNDVERRWDVILGEIREIFGLRMVRPEPLCLRRPTYESLGLEPHELRARRALPRRSRRVGGRLQQQW